MRLALSHEDLMRVARLKKITEDNDRVLRLFADYLNLTPRMIDARTVRELAAECEIPTDDAYRTLLCAACGLEIPDSAEDRRLERTYFRPSLRRLSPEVYRNDEYARTVSFSDLSVGKWHFTHGGFCAYEPFVCGHPTLTEELREIPSIGYFDEPFRYPSVTENGVEWMTVTPNEVETMREPIARAHGDVLTYGLGLGYFAFHASQKETVGSVTVVERDEALVGLFSDRILPQFPQAKKIRIVCADAFAFTEQIMQPKQFDFAFVDLWHDQSDGLPLYLRMKRLEARFPETEFSYWIEPTLLSSLRRMVTDRIFEEDGGAEIRSFEEIRTMLSDVYLRTLAPNLRKIEP